MSRRFIMIIVGVVIVVVSALAIFGMTFNASTDIAQTPLAPSDADQLAQFPRPSEPAGLDVFREDHPSQVASTGNPQLIEFFAFT